jgi:hypothetical protein
MLRWGRTTRWIGAGFLLALGLWTFGAARPCIGRDPIPHPEPFFVASPFGTAIVWPGGRIERFGRYWRAVRRDADTLYLAHEKPPGRWRVTDAAIVAERTELPNRRALHARSQDVVLEGGRRVHATRDALTITEPGRRFTVRSGAFFYIVSVGRAANGNLYVFEDSLPHTGGVAELDPEGRFLGWRVAAFGAAHGSGTDLTMDQARRLAAFLHAKEEVLGGDR